MIMDRKMSKGDVLGVAQTAGIMGAKKTSELIPMCHPLNITSVEISFASDKGDARVGITARVKLSGKTGVEMEALTAVSTAALTIYDMCKAVDKGMKITNIRLIEKSGGKSGTYRRDDDD
jgi:cyclic pyranopterin phosphate synthase